MVNVRLLVEYDGSRFHGWQMQPGQRTIEGELERIISLVLREPIHPLYASGRTDAGVHARGQVVNFHTSRDPDLLRLAHSVSNMLRGELSVLRAEIVPDDFHARHSAVCKQYTYRILNRLGPAVLDRGQAWYIGTPLDADFMHDQARALLGEHDFASFQAAGCTSRTAVKTIFESEVCVSGPYILYRVVGSGFLKHMVRIIAGTLVDLARRKLSAQTMLEVLAAKDRTVAGLTAPAYGLCLDWVRYSEAEIQDNAPGALR